jgi:hypothetical protein
MDICQVRSFCVGVGVGVGVDVHIYVWGGGVYNTTGFRMWQVFVFIVH